MSESLSHVAQQSLSNLITFQDLIKKFDSDAVPLLCFCHLAEAQHLNWALDIWSIHYFPVTMRYFNLIMKWQTIDDVISQGENIHITMGIDIK